MTSALEHRVYLIERELFTDGDTWERVRNLESRLDELEERLREGVRESLIRESQLAAREQAVKAREEKYARVVAAHPLPVRHPKDAWLTSREKAVVAREEAVKAREESYARTVSTNPLPPPHPKDKWLTDLAAGAKYLQYIAAGWTDELLEQHQIMVVPR